VACAGPAAASKIKLNLNPANKSAKPSDVQSYSFGASNTVSIGSGSGGGGTGKARFDELQITKAVDANTMDLLTHLTQGQHYPAVSLSFTNGPFALTYCLGFVVVTKDKQDAAKEDSAPTEQVSLAFGSVTEKLGLATFSWDQVLNDVGDDQCSAGSSGSGR